MTDRAIKGRAWPNDLRTACVVRVGSTWWSRDRNDTHSYRMAA